MSAAESTFGPDSGGHRKSGARTAYVVKKGILSKKSRSKYMSGPWTLRTVVLNSDNKLLYFDGKVLKGEIILAGTMINHMTPDPSDGRVFPFQITNISSVKMTQTSAMTLAAGSYQEADEWVTCLNKAAAGSTSTGAAGYITFEDVAASGVSAKAVDARELREKRLKAHGSKDNLLKYGDVVDSSDDDDEDDC